MNAETVNRCRKEADSAYIIYAEAKRIFIDAQADYLKKVRRFRNYDYELALTDGRLKKIPPSRVQKETKQPELTLEQLKAIANKLGVNISIETPETESETLIEALKGNM